MQKGKNTKKFAKNPAGIFGEGRTVNNCYNSRTHSLFTSEVLVVGPISCTVSLKKNTKDRKKAWKEQKHFCKDLAGNCLVGSYNSLLVPHSLFKLTNMTVSKPTNMKVDYTHQHEPLLDRRTLSTSVTQPPLYCTVCMPCLRSLCYHEVEPCTFPVIRLM